MYKRVAQRRRSHDAALCEGPHNISGPTCRHSIAAEGCSALWTRGVLGEPSLDTTLVVHVLARCHCDFLTIRKVFEADGALRHVASGSPLLRDDLHGHRRNNLGCTPRRGGGATALAREACAGGDQARQGHHHALTIATGPHEIHRYHRFNSSSILGQLEVPLPILSWLPNAFASAAEHFEALGRLWYLIDGITMLAQKQL